MKLTFIGTSHGVPEAGRRCSCTMIQVGENVYFVDMGTQAIEDLRRMDIAPERVKAVFITHMHGDHVNGLLSFVDICNWYFTAAEPAVFLPTCEGAGAVKNWVETLDKRDFCRIEPRVTDEGVIYDDGVLNVTAARTQHTRRSFAYFLRAEGKTLLFTSDLKGAQTDFPTAAFGMKLDAVICESAHVPPMDYIPVFEKCDISRVFVTHIQPRKEEQARELQKSLAGKLPVFIPRDGGEYVI